MNKINREYLKGERALFQAKDTLITDCTFADGESPLKESRDIELCNSTFKWKYPLWYSKNIVAERCILFNTARAGIWYTDNIKMKDCLIEAPKTFRRTSHLTLENVNIPNADETLWNCENVVMKNVIAKGDYFAMNCKNMEIENFTLTGNYSFDGAKNVVIRNATMLSKDSFWNSENITVYDSYISGEYLGWNSKNLTLVNCTIESLQGMCYIDNLIMKNCKLINTTLAFEYSSVDVSINGGIDSVLNPSCGTIVADNIGTLIIEEGKVDKEKTKILLRSENEI